MIPPLVSLPGSPWDVLPAGIHTATVAEVRTAFAYNEKRRWLLEGLIEGAACLVSAGCQVILLDGSYVTGKEIPGDYDACWEPSGVDFNKLDVIFDDFDNGRAAQKGRFRGEFFPSTLIEAGLGKAFVEFFQIDRFTGKRKGILSLPIGADEAVLRRIK